MQRLLNIAMLLLCIGAAEVWPQAQSENQAINDILARSDNYLQLVQTEWAKISSGDVRAMVVSHEAINNCWHFKSEIERSSDIDAFEDILRQERPREIVFGKGIYYKCQALVSRLNEFPGWQELRLRAALAGHVSSRLHLVLDFYRYQHERPREAFAYSPAGFLTDALLEGHSVAFSVVGEIGVDYGLRQDRSETTSIAWSLISCRIRGDCDQPSSMALLCANMAPECAESRTVYEMLERRAGSEEEFAEANRRADQLHARVKQQRFEELDLILVW